MIYFFLIISLIFPSTIFAQTWRITSQSQHPYRHTPRDLNSGTDDAADEECVTYESSTGLFEWQTCGSGGVATTDFDTSAELRGILQDETGTGQAVFNNTPTITGLVVCVSIDLPSDAVNAITEIATAIKTGADLKLATGTAGTAGNCVEWNADGDLVEAASAAACGSGGSGDNITVNGSAAANANFINGEINWTLNTIPTPNTISEIGR